MIAFNGVRSSCDMFARNSDLCWLAASSSRLFSSSSASAVASSRVRSSTFCSRPAVRLLEPRRHAVELLGEGTELVAARDLDPLVERPGADLRRRGLDRLDRPDEPASEQHAGRDRQEQERDQEQRRAPDRRLERRERLAQRLLDEDPPAERLDRLEGAQHLRPVLVAPGRGDRVRLGAASCERRSHLRERGEARVPQDEVDVRMGDELAAASRPRTRIRSCRSAPGRSTSLTKLRSIVGDDDAPPGRSLGDGDRHVGLRAPLEVDATEVPLVRPRADERGVASRGRCRCRRGRARAGETADASLPRASR